MPEIELKGLPAHHAAAALAVYGLYAIIPDCKIYYKQQGRLYYPVLQSQYKTIDELVKFLTERGTWDSLHLPGDKGDNLNSGLTLEDFSRFKKTYPIFASGLATDLRLLKKKDKDLDSITVSYTPTNFINFANKTFYQDCDGVLKLLIDKDRQTKMDLTSFPWIKQIGPDFGLFFNNTGENVFTNNAVVNNSKAKKPKNAKKDKKVVVLDEKMSDEKYFTVPIICMLVVASWRTLACFVQNKKVLIPGWKRDNTFVYPIFTNPISAKEAISWLCHPDLENYSRNKIAWNKIGINAVYAVRKRSKSKGGGNLMSAYQM